MRLHVRLRQWGYVKVFLKSIKNGNRWHEEIHDGGIEKKYVFFILFFVWFFRGGDGF